MLIIFNGYRVYVWDDEEVLEMDGGNGCTTFWINLMPLNCTLWKMDTLVSCMLCIFYHKNMCKHESNFKSLRYS